MEGKPSSSCHIRDDQCKINTLSPFQTAFVLGRKVSDNVIIAQEIIHSLNKKKGGVRYMVLKIDLEKAYDKIEWSFIRDMLTRVNLPVDLWDIIMSCVSTVSTSILFNGEALDPIYPSKGDKVRGSFVPVFVYSVHGLPWAVDRREMSCKTLVAS